MAIMAKAVGWRACFYLAAGVGGVSGTLTLLFSRGHPSSYGYESVNPNAGERNFENDLTCGRRLEILWQNFKTVVANGHFWTAGMSWFFTNGPFYSVNGLWGGPYLRHVFGYDKVKSGDALMGISVGLIVGPVIMTLASDFFRTRKLAILVGNLIGFCTLAVFYFWREYLHFAHVFLLLMVYACGVNASSPVCYAMVREYYPSAVSATAVGCANAFAFVAGAIDQPVTGMILEHFGSVTRNGEKAYTEIGYKWGLLIFSGAQMIIGLVLITLVKDTDFDKEEQQFAVAESRDVQSILESESH
jgi:sugar phosphate permease